MPSRRPGCRHLWADVELRDTAMPPGCPAWPTRCWAVAEHRASEEEGSSLPRGGGGSVTAKAGHGCQCGALTFLALHWLPEPEGGAAGLVALPLRPCRFPRGVSSQAALPGGRGGLPRRLQAPLIPDRGPCAAHVAAWPSVVSG